MARACAGRTRVRQRLPGVFDLDDRLRRGVREVVINGDDRRTQLASARRDQPDEWRLTVPELVSLIVLVISLINY
ncbi:hypothetical protein C489_18821 [Natrinema versiforme JCM 10478]|uniref:Uncharacterized protein n=2 Tax=Natrinema versiforme TaxID=88724 RepID=L9XNZ1_9EURY|nr:hypothetical protein C489_18821 [Natrinema versiforme JCM 10478]